MRRIVVAVTSGTSPYSTSTSPPNPSSAARACATAWPVPSCSAWCATATPLPASAPSICSRPAPVTTTVRAGASSATLASSVNSIGRPAIGCSTLCRVERIRVPLPAARMMTASGRSGGVDMARLLPRLPCQDHSAGGTQPTMTRFSPFAANPFTIVGFDLDGTLLDSAGDLTAALNHALAAGGHAPLGEAEAMKLVGGGARHLLAEALARDAVRDEAEVDRLLPLMLDHYAANIDVHSHLFPGAIAAIDALRGRGVNCAVVTNKRESFTRELLRRFQLVDRFACVIGGDTLGTGRAKPKPDMVLAMIEQCGGGRAAFVGDSIYDVAAARAAGVPVVACSFGYSQTPAAQLGADAVIDGFDRLIATLDRLATT